MSYPPNSFEYPPTENFSNKRENYSPLNLKL
jgi:hypothetical protein